MEISASSEEGEAPRPKDKGRDVAPSSSLMGVDEALPEAAEHVQPDDCNELSKRPWTRHKQQAVKQALTGKRRRCRRNQPTPQPKP